jgi:hypothetical protein
LALTSDLGSLFIFAKITLSLGWQKKNFLSWRIVICIFKKSGGRSPFCVLGSSMRISPAHLTAISTFCIKNLIFTTSTQLSLTKIFTFCRKFQKNEPRLRSQ